MRSAYSSEASGQADLVFVLRVSFRIGDQPKMRRRIAGMNCIADFSQLLQKFGRL